MFNRILPAIAAVATLAISSIASAHVVSMDLFTGQWQNATGGPTNLNFSGNGGNNPQVRWGVDLGSGQSGYNLDMAPPPPVPIVQNVPPNTSPFKIGNFTHVNFPIGPNSITGIDLEVTFDITIDGVDLGLHNFFFHFAHDETTNSGACPYGGANGQGVNINGCADRVLVSFLDASDSFDIGGTLYTFNLLGFSTNGGSTISNQYLTVEGLSNTADLYATIQTRESVHDTPEPGTLVLLGLGLVGLTLARRRMH
jgi:hypothetical protein